MCSAQQLQQQQHQPCDLSPHLLHLSLSLSTPYVCNCNNNKYKLNPHPPTNKPTTSKLTPKNDVNMHWSSTAHGSSEQELYNWRLAIGIETFWSIWADYHFIVIYVFILYMLI